MALTIEQNSIAPLAGLRSLVSPYSGQDVCSSALNTATPTEIGQRIDARSRSRAHNRAFVS